MRFPREGEKRAEGENLPERENRTRAKKVASLLSTRRLSRKMKEKKQARRETTLAQKKNTLCSHWKTMAATARRLSLPQFVPIAIRRARELSCTHSLAAKADSPEKLPFPLPSSSSASSSSSLAALSPLCPPPPPPPPPPPWPRAVALDVEFSHYQKLEEEGDDRLVVRVPADVAVVSDEGEVLLRALVYPPPGVSSSRTTAAKTETKIPPQSSCRWIGGVPREEAEYEGLELDLVVAELARILSGGCLLVGHGVSGDMRALRGEVVSGSASSSPSSSSDSLASPSLSISASRVRDTSTSPGLLKMNNKHKASSSTKLETLFFDAFALRLRPPSPSPAVFVASSSPSLPPLRHDPVADAAAAMALYLTFVKGTLADAASATELEEMETRRVLQEFRSRGGKGKGQNERRRCNE